MTTMPDLIAQTRIFKGIEALLNKPARTSAELKAWQDALKSNQEITTLIETLRTSYGYGLRQADFDHFKYEVFNQTPPSGSKKGYWGDDPEPITTEGFAHLLEHMIYYVPYAPHTLQNTRPQPRRVCAFWLCPVTYYYRTIITRNDHNDDWINFFVVTPPKGDHKIHHKEYKKRVKKKEPHDEMPDKYDQIENIWVTSHLGDSVRKGKRKSDGADIPIALLMNSITGVADVETVQLLSEDY